LAFLRCHGLLPCDEARGRCRSALCRQ
jgi:hypothetical protein